MKIVLTFDIERDIPNILNTYFGVKVGLLKILKLLDNFHINATFFCTGNVAEHLPEYIRLIERKGHEIACHGLSHGRLNHYNLKKCQEIISKNKKIIENVCQNSEIIGFRSPYLDPPRYLFKVLNNLGYKYDSSLKSHKKVQFYHNYNNGIQEFPPSNYNIFFRIPINYSLLLKWILKKKIIILYFHPKEVINMKDVIRNQMSAFNKFLNLSYRPDRWFYTGDIFTTKIHNFIKGALLKKAEFLTLKQLYFQERQ
ncbi:MAG: polysaccharide deacetylase family protein [Candidatus Hermodarchaeota archaeon]